MIILLLAFVFSYSLVAFVLPKILLLSLRKRLFDPIDPRKVHNVPASRLGGIAFFPAILFSMWSCIVICNVAPESWGLNMNVDIRLTYLSLSLLLLFLIGIYDDLIGVSYRIKFLVQIIAALLMIGSGAYIKTFHGAFGIYDIPYYVGIPITLGLYVFITNAINLIDGIDGLASMLSMMALLAYSIILYFNRHPQFSIVAVAALGALLPFWYCNVFGIKKRAKSKIFMGDTGSLVIGAILGFTAVKTWNITSNSYGDPINEVCCIITYTMLLVPCFDVIRVMIHRFRKGNPIFQPDKNHIHHKFMAMGLSPHKSLVLIMLLSLSFLILNLFLSLVLDYIYIAVIDVLVWSYIHRCISRIIKG